MSTDRRSHMKSRKVSLLRIVASGFLSAAFLLPVSGQAQIKEGSVELSPFVGFSWFENGQNLNDTLIYGGRVGYNITRNWGIEGTAEFINTGVAHKSRTGVKEGQFRSPTN